MSGFEVEILEIASRVELNAGWLGVDGRFVPLEEISLVKISESFFFILGEVRLNHRLPHFALRDSRKAEVVAPCLVVEAVEFFFDLPEVVLEAGDLLHALEPIVLGRVYLIFFDVIVFSDRRIQGDLALLLFARLVFLRTLHLQRLAAVDFKVTALSLF